MPISILQPPTAAAPPPAQKVAGPLERWLWISARNVTRELTHFVDGAQVLKGMVGRYAPTPYMMRDVIPGVPGQRMREIHHDMRELDMPLLLMSDGYNDLQALISQMVRDMDAVAGTGTLRHVAIDGATSDLFCRCVGGLGVDSEGQSGPIAHKATLVFQADDPYWYGETIQQSFSGATTTAWFDILPVHIGNAGVLGDVVINNVGDVTAWPIWLIQGPGSNPTFTNVTTGQTLSLAVTLGATDRVTIDTRPGFKSVVGPSGVNFRQYLTNRQLWGLASGHNSVNLSMSGADASSYVTLAYRPPLLVPGLPSVAQPPPVSPVPVTTVPGGPAQGTYTSLYGSGY